jgi:hypothetical protein
MISSGATKQLTDSNILYVYKVPHVMTLYIVLKKKNRANQTELIAGLFYLPRWRVMTDGQPRVT